MWATGRIGSCSAPPPPSIQILTPSNLVDFGGCGRALQHTHLPVLGLRRDHLCGFRGPGLTTGRTRKHRNVAGHKGPTTAMGLGFVHPLLKLCVSVRLTFGPISVPLWATVIDLPSQKDETRALKSDLLDEVFGSYAEFQNTGRPRGTPPQSWGRPHS